MRRRLSKARASRSIPLCAAATLVAALALAPIAAARPATTSPAAPSYVEVVITNQSVSVSDGSSAARGTWIIFHITNRSTSTAKLSFLGAIGKPIAPSHRGALAVFAGRRGAFPLVTSLAERRSLQRTFIVY
jgi:hypothetical protein